MGNVLTKKEENTKVAGAFFAGGLTWFATRLAFNALRGPKPQNTNNIVDGWFMEKNDKLWPGQAQSLRVKNVIHEEKSDFQDVLVFESTNHGKVLVLDGAIQVTENDEFSYQEMITNLPICSKANDTVKKVLVIGGGDGGVVREVLRHSSVEEVHLCEIDSVVVKVAKEHFTGLSCCLEDSRVKVHIQDGAKFLKENPGKFDIIIVDSSDPVGPAESLFGKDFYESAYNALTEGGVLCTQAESIWLHLGLIADMLKFIREIFPTAEYAYTTIPTYPSGSIGFFLCSKSENHSCKIPAISFGHPDVRYYTPEIHEAAFVLPKFAKDKLKF